MRKFILITAMVLASASAHAGQRSLTVASSEQPATTATTAKPADTAPATTPAATAPAATSPTYVERPSAAAPDCAPTTAEAPKSTPKDVAASEKPKRHHVSTEARVISELHRHGIYW